MAAPIPPQLDRAALEMEYIALRDELTKRFQFRQQIVSINLTIASLLLGYGYIQKGQLINSFSPSAALIYPPIAFFLALGWAQGENRIRDLNTYVRIKIEAQIPSLEWETYMEAKRANREQRLGLKGSVAFWHGGVFWWPQILSLLIGLNRFIEFDCESSWIPWPMLKSSSCLLLDYILLFVDLIAICLCFFLFYDLERHARALEERGLEAISSDLSWMP